MEYEKEIIESLDFIKRNSPQLHLYTCGKLLERAERGTSIIRQLDARRSLGSILHISKNAQLVILKELEFFQLLIKINRKEYLIPITFEEYNRLFNIPLKQTKYGIKR